MTALPRARCAARRGIARLRRPGQWPEAATVRGAALCDWGGEPGAGVAAATALRAAAVSAASAGDGSGRRRGRSDGLPGRRLGPKMAGEGCAAAGSVAIPCRPRRRCCRGAPRKMRDRARRGCRYPPCRPGPAPPAAAPPHRRCPDGHGWPARPLARRARPAPGQDAHRDIVGDPGGHRVRQPGDIACVAIAQTIGGGRDGRHAEKIGAHDGHTPAPGDGRDGTLRARCRVGSDSEVMQRPLCGMFNPQ